MFHVIRTVLTVCAEVYELASFHSCDSISYEPHRCTCINATLSTPKILVRVRIHMHMQEAAIACRRCVLYARANASWPLSLSSKEFDHESQNLENTLSVPVATFFEQYSALPGIFIGPQYCVWYESNAAQEPGTSSCNSS